MESQKLYRKRLIPEETVLLDRDRIIRGDSDTLITAWECIRPKAVLASGFSCYYFKEGFKISRFYDHDGNFMYWYCDIIHTEHKDDSYVFTDLLADVVIKPDGSVKILDLDELADAFEQGLISGEYMTQALRQLHCLLGHIYAGSFDALAAPLLEAIDS